MADLVIGERPGLNLATVMARKGVDAAAIGEALGVTLGDAPRLHGSDELSLLGTGPGIWLALWPDGAPDPGDRLAGLAAVVDQSGAYVVLRIAGADARALLQRGVAIDLHPDVFGPGAVATTVIAQLGVILWRVDDGFEIAVFRSSLASFRDWLEWARIGLDAR